MILSEQDKLEHCQPDFWETYPLIIFKDGCWVQHIGKEETTAQLIHKLSFMERQANLEAYRTALEVHKL